MLVVMAGLMALTAGWPSAVLGSGGGGWRIISQGSFGSRHWGVEVAPDGSGICLEDLVWSTGRRATALGAGQCSHPVAVRGALVVAVDLSKKGKPLVTVIGGAFAAAVARVRVERFDGSKEWLPVRKGGVGPFHYLAVGQRGAWCVRRITTVSSAGRRLWSGTWKEFSQPLGAGLSFDPRPYC